MADTKDLEATIGGWYEAMKLPHLPKEGQKWLANNVWWLALIGAILSVLGLLAIVPLFLLAVGIGAAVSVVTVAYSGLFWLSSLITVVAYIGTTILLIMAINPLKAKAKRGWQLLFWSYLINFAFAIVSGLIVFSVMSIVTSLIGAAIAGYFLYEIRGYFGAHHKHAKAEA
jgi:hypothetical protein